MSFSEGRLTVIQSENNERIKRWRKYRQARGRIKEGGFLVESRKLVADLIASPYEIESLVCREENLDSLLADLQSLGRRFNDPGYYRKLDSLPKVLVDDQLFGALSEMEKSDGLIAVGRGKIYSRALSADEADSISLCLDRLQDPGNVGALLRSAEAFGIRTVIGLGSVDFENPKLLRASMGSAFRLRLIATGRDEYLNYLDRQEVSLVVADMEGEDYRTFSWPEKLSILMGNEGGGVAADLMARADCRISIPMQGLVESLNVTVSASLLMAQRQAFISGRI